MLSRNWSLVPSIVLGHSFGEFAASCVAGFLSVDCALDLVITRSQLIESLVPKGIMMAIRASGSVVSDVIARLGLAELVEVSVRNNSSSCCVSGSVQAVSALKEHLQQVQLVECRDIGSSYAFHSRDMDVVVEPFIRAATLVLQRHKQISRKESATQMLSNLTGTWISAKDILNGEYWAAQMRSCVRFEDQLQVVTKAIAQDSAILLEVGPGSFLTNTVRNEMKVFQGAKMIVESCMGRRKQHGEVCSVLQAMCSLWQQDAEGSSTRW
jgi:acyl transferase domain-containing protein